MIECTIIKIKSRFFSKYFKLLYTLILLPEAPPAFILQISLNPDSEMKKILN